MPSNEADRQGETIVREVAPGLVMEKRLTSEADGRYLMYYRFQRGAPEQPTIAAVTLRVPEMVCDGCATSIRQALAGVPGVAGVEVDLAGKEVRVAYDERQTGEAALREAIEQAGFEVV